jgi:disulfide bond formation protein DsbB
VTTDAVSLFLALLAVLAEVAVVLAIVLVVAGRVSPGVARARTAVADVVAPQALGLALAVAAVATSGSLYFSEVAHFTPCRLCWYQRICMYPLVPLLAWGGWRRDLQVRVLATALAGVGAAIASYHVLIERYPTLESGACDPTNPCSLIWVRRFGYLTIPTMALSAVALILTLLAGARRDDGG